MAYLYLMNPKNTLPRKKWVKLVLLVALAIAISVFSLFPSLVEKGYSTGIYPGISATLRILFGRVPFSIGDIIYACIVIRLIIRIIRGVIVLRRKQYTRLRLYHLLYRYGMFLLWVYIVFKLCWGLNYDRQGITSQLGLTKPAYTKEEVTTLTNQLIDKVNAARREIKDTTLPSPPLDSLYLEAHRAYQSVSLDLDFLNYRNRSVKGSLFSGIGDYMGFSGYYNPFTGEAQVRTDIPRILIPYIACHEMAHQLGYASESEANFVGYLAATASQDPYFRYSVYLDLFSYAQSEEIFWYGKDKDFKAFEAVIKQNRQRLDTLVKKDRREIREFFNKRKNRVSPAVSGLYDQYLKMNKQSQGIESYNEVIGWLIAYQKKYGKL
ncbi:MAG: hypothetical protein JWQ78_188 [Sediminibacterium sp.]|nr:hypothetical protein [Sediminibacterium sp.]